MIFQDAHPSDAKGIASIVNDAYRAADGNSGWTNERELLAGNRTSEAGVRSMLERGRILIGRERPETAILGCIHIAVDRDGAWHTSMLAVDPHTQTSGVGKALKGEVERQARAAGVSLMRMEVIKQREALIAWHQRRGYVLTGETLPFPYDDPSVGKPLRPDLELVVMEKHLT